MPRLYLDNTSQVSIIPCAWINKMQSDNSYTMLIMGATGAGKSTFIEALAGPGHTLGISKDQLAGFTQDVSCFKIQNAVVKWDDSKYPVFLIDTPGFSDSKISEMEIINKVKTWMKDQRIVAVNVILYLTPITDTRVPGSKRRTIKMLQSLLDNGSATRVTIVTTMWDRVSNAQAMERAEAHFVQLRDDVWKDLVDEGAQVVRFQNNQTSAIDIVRVSVIQTTGEIPLWVHPISGADRSAPLLYQELLDRISNSRQEIEVLRVDHIQLIANPDPLLESVVVPRLHEANQTLTKFLGQLVQFGNPPPGFEGAPQRIVCQHLLDNGENARQDIAAFKNARAQTRKLDWIRRSHMTTAIQKAEARLSELSRYLDASGNPQVPAGYEGLMEVLKLLRPKVTIAERMKAEFTSLTKKVTRH